VYTILRCLLNALTFFISLIKTVSFRPTLFCSWGVNVYQIYESNRFLLFKPSFIRFSLTQLKLSTDILA